MSDLVFITGAKGFLGRHSARHFSGAGWIVAGLGHGEWSEKERQDWGLRFWETGPVSVENLERLAEHAGLPQAVIHCAGSGSVGFSYERPVEDFQRTVASTVAVLEFARKYESGIRVVYPSSAAVYGASMCLPMDESMPPTPVSPYGKHKLMAEECCRMFAAEWNLPVAVLRFFSLYGEGLRKQLLWDACRKAALEKFAFFGNGTEMRDWLHVRDAAKLMALALEHATPDCPVVNGGTGCGVTVKDILTSLGGQCRPALEPIFSGHVKAGDPAHQVAAVEKARLWGFAPSVRWQDGVSAYVDWFRTEGSKA